jgi:hypothetical protein
MRANSETKSRAFPSHNLAPPPTTTATNHQAHQRVRPFTPLTRPDPMGAETPVRTAVGCHFWTSPREVDTGAMRPWSMVAG